MEEIKDSLVTLAGKVAALEETVDVPGMKKTIATLEKEVQRTDLWHDEDKARETTTRLAHLQEEAEEIDSLAQEIDEALALVDMAGHDDEAMKADLGRTLKALQQRYTQLETKRLLNGPYDQNEAIIAIHAGQGGTEACDWANMLRRMYLRYCERRRWQAELVEESVAEEAGIKAATYLVKGKQAYGWLKGEAGTHRLVRLSPFNADNLRQTSFALVEVLPHMESSDEIMIKDEELEWSFFRSGGKGGQNVNKVNTAVRLKHIPTGIIVESQAQRFQEQNRKIALALLTAKLWQRQEADKQKELAALKGTTMASWGSQIRSYVLHPYQLVKDVRTGVETSDTAGVLAGNLDEFISAELRWLA